MWISRTRSLAGAGLALILCWAAPGQAQTRYTFADTNSTFTYAMEHPMHSWTATSRQATGEVSIGPDCKTAEIAVSIPVVSFDSGNSNRDSHMAEAVESYIYGEVTFKGKVVGLDSLQTSPAGQTTGIWAVSGDLNFHGVEKALACPVHFSVAKDQATATGSFAIKVTDFAVELPSLLGVKTKDEIRLAFAVVAKPAKAAP